MFLLQVVEVPAVQEMMINQKKNQQHVVVLVVLMNNKGFCPFKRKDGFIWNILLINGILQIIVIKDVNIVIFFQVRAENVCPYSSVGRQLLPNVRFLAKLTTEAELLPS